MNYKFVLMLLLFCFLRTSQANDTNCVELNDVSIISLIAIPDNFNGLCVRTRGVLVLDDRSGRLFLNQESLSNNVLANSILILISSEEIAKIQDRDRSYVTISGVFNNQAIVQVLDISLY